MDITKIILHSSNGREVTIKLDDLSAPLKKKLRKESEKYFSMKRPITEPTYNEDYHGR